MNPPWVGVFLATAMGWAGALIAAVLRNTASRFMRPIVYVSLLFFAVAAVFDILPESKQSLSWPVFVAAVAGGYGVLWLIGRYVSPICPSCALRSFEDGHRHLDGGGLAMLSLVLVSHCFIDGLGVSAASTVDASFGLRVFGAIAVHKIPEGFALALVLMTGNRSPWQAFRWTFGIEIATLAGALAGALWWHPSAFGLALVLAHVGGTFLYLSASGLQDALSPRLAPAAMTR